MPPPEVFWPEVHERFEQALSLSPLYPFDDIVPLLESLREAQVPMAVASSSARGRLDHVLAAAELSAYFSFTLSANDVAHAKPNPDLYLLAAERFDVPPTACLAVEDSAVGVAAARAAGMPVIHVRRGGPAVAGVTAVNNAWGLWPTRRSEWQASAV